MIGFIKNNCRFAILVLSIIMLCFVVRINESTSNASMQKIKKMTLKVGSIKTVRIIDLSKKEVNSFTVKSSDGRIVDVKKGKGLSFKVIGKAEGHAVVYFTAQYKKAKNGVKKYVQKYDVNVISDIKINNDENVSYFESTEDDLKHVELDSDFVIKASNGKYYHYVGIKNTGNRDFEICMGNSYYYKNDELIGEGKYMSSTIDFFGSTVVSPGEKTIICFDMPDVNGNRIDFDKYKLKIWPEDIGYKGIKSTDITCNNMIIKYDKLDWYDDEEPGNCGNIVYLDVNTISEISERHCYVLIKRSGKVIDIRNLCFYDDFEDGTKCFRSEGLNYNEYHVPYELTDSVEVYAYGGVSQYSQYH